MRCRSSARLQIQLYSVFVLRTNLEVGILGVCDRSRHACMRVACTRACFFMYYIAEERLKELEAKILGDQVPLRDFLRVLFSSLQ